MSTESEVEYQLDAETGPGDAFRVTATRLADGAVWVQDGDEACQFWDAIPDDWELEDFNRFMQSCNQSFSKQI